MSELYNRYSSTHAGRASREGTTRWVRKLVAPHVVNGAILDVGCGQGLLIQALSELGFGDVSGVDISEEQVKVAVENGANDVVLGDYLDVLRRRKWTTIVATDFVEHLPRAAVPGFFRECFGALTSGGRLIVRSPNGTSPFFGYYQYGDFTHETVLTPRSFHQLAAVSGYVNPRCLSCPPISHGFVSAVRRAVWGCSALILRLMIASETGDTRTIVSQNFLGVAERP